MGDLENDRLLLKGPGGEILLLLDCGDLLLHLLGDLEYLLAGDLENLI